MAAQPGAYIPYFPLFFAGLWFFITVLLGLLSGWYGLMSRFPDRPDGVRLRIGNLSGSMGLTVNMGGILTLSVCDGGLRVSMFRVFGPFCRDFYVPWSELSVARRDRLLWKVARLGLGRPEVGHLTIRTHVADRLAAAAGADWPEDGVFVPETTGQIASRIGLEWLVITILASTFFILAPRLMGAEAAAPPIALCIAFPAVSYGIVALVKLAWNLARR